MLPPDLDPWVAIAWGVAAVCVGCFAAAIVGGIIGEMSDHQPWRRPKGQPDGRE